MLKSQDKCRNAELNRTLQNWKPCPVKGFIEVLSIQNWRLGPANNASFDLFCHAFLWLELNYNSRRYSMLLFIHKKSYCNYVFEHIKSDDIWHFREIVYFNFNLVTSWNYNNKLFIQTRSSPYTSNDTFYNAKAIL